MTIVEPGSLPIGGTKESYNILKSQEIVLEKEEKSSETSENKKNCSEQKEKSNMEFFVENVRREEEWLKAQFTTVFVVKFVQYLM